MVRSVASLPLIFYLVSSLGLRRTRDSSVSVPEIPTTTLHCFGPQFGMDEMTDKSNCVKMGGSDGDTLAQAIEKIGNELVVDGRDEAEKLKTLMRKEVELSVAVTEFYEEGGYYQTDKYKQEGYDPANDKYKQAMDTLGSFMKGTPVVHPDIAQANIVDPFTNKVATGLVEAIFYAERIKYDSLTVKPVQIRTIWSGVEGKDKVNAFIEAENAKSKVRLEKGSGKGSPIVYASLGNTALGMYFEFRDSTPCQTTPCDLETVLNTKPNVDGTKSFTIANVCEQKGFPCVLGAHEYKDHDATLDTSLDHKPLDAGAAHWYDHPDRKMPLTGWGVASREFMMGSAPFMKAMIEDDKEPVLHSIMDTHGQIMDPSKVLAFVKKKVAMKTEIPAFWEAVDKKHFNLEVHSHNQNVALAIHRACEEHEPKIDVTTIQRPGIGEEDAIHPYDSDRKETYEPDFEFEDPFDSYEIEEGGNPRDVPTHQKKTAVVEETIDVI